MIALPIDMSIYDVLYQGLDALKILAKDCKFEAVTATEYRDQSIRDSFINGISSNAIRQRLLENSQLDLDTAVKQAKSMETACNQAETYVKSHCTVSAAAASEYSETKDPSKLSFCENDSSIDSSKYSEPTVSSISTNQKCFFCGLRRHPRSKCPAKDSSCNKCGKVGHYAKVC